MLNRKIYTGTIVSYLIVFLLPFIFNMFTLRQVSNTVEENIGNSVLIALQHTREWLDEDFTMMNEIVANLSSNTTIRYMATQLSEESKKIEISKLRQGQEYAKAFRVQNLMEEYYVFLQKPELALSSDSVFLDQESTRFFFRYAGMEWEEWESLLQGYYNKKFFPEARTLQNNNYQEIFLYVQSLLIGNRSKGTFVFPIPSSIVKDRMKNNYVSQAGWAYLLDGEGQMLFSIPSAQDEFLKIDSAMLEDREIQKVNIDGRSLMVVQTRSDYMNLTYVAVIPEEYILGEINMAQRNQLLLLIFVFIAGAIVISLLSWKKGRKIVGITELILSGQKNGDNGPNMNKDAMEYISKSVQRLIESNESLREDIRKQEPVTRGLLIERLLTGGIEAGNEQMRHSLERYGIHLEGKGLLVFLFSMRDPRILEPDMGVGESSIYQPLLHKELEDLYGKWHYICDMDVDSTAVILVLQEEWTGKEEIAKPLQEMCRRYRQEYGVNLRVAVSNCCAGGQNISKAYDQIREMMEYNANTEAEILFYDEYQDKKEYYYYPMVVEERLINAVKSGNTETVHEQLHQVFTSNVLERNLSPDMMHFLVNDLQCTIFKILHSLGDISLDEEHLKKELEALSGERELLNRFRHINEIFHFLCEKVAQNNHEDKNRIVADITDYVERNYADQGLSLTQIADHFGYASTYFSKLFKELFGMNFTNYLEQIRIAQVCRLLEQEMTLEAIAELTGYNSTHVLRTAFKRIKGITPNDYRKSKS